MAAGVKLERKTKRFPDGFLLNTFAAAVRAGEDNGWNHNFMNLTESLMPPDKLFVIRQKIYARIGLKIGTRDAIPPNLTNRPRRMSRA